MDRWWNRGSWLAIKWLPSAHIKPHDGVYCVQRALADDTVSLRGDYYRYARFLHTAPHGGCVVEESIRVGEGRCSVDDSVAYLALHELEDSPRPCLRAGALVASAYPLPQCQRGPGDLGLVAAGLHAARCTPTSCQTHCSSDHLAKARDRMHSCPLSSSSFFLSFLISSSEEPTFV